MTSPYSVLFVCMGNICRSPTAEAIFQEKINQARLTHLIKCDSAGTIGFHEGKPSDPRMSRFASERGYHLTSKSRKILLKDFDDFDLIVTMDNDNYDQLQIIAKTEAHCKKIRKMISYAQPNTPFKEVPDPYYGGNDGFVAVVELLEDACSGLFKRVRDDIEA